MGSTDGRIARRPRDMADLDLLMIGFVGGTGGASVLMRELGTALVQRGVRAGIAVPAWDSAHPYADECRARGIPVIETPWLQEREPRTRAYADALRVALRLRAAIVHYHLSTNVMPGRYLRPVQLLGARPSFVTLHDPYEAPPPDSPAARRWAGAAPHLFERIVCVSEAGRVRQLRYGIPAARLQLIYNGVDVARFARGRADLVRAQLGLDESARIILVSSRIAPQKRPFDALEAFARIAADRPDTHLVMLGDGALRADVRAEAVRRALGDRVHLPGHRSNVPDWLAAATAWFLPTESEAFSLAVIEAMAAGLPIVTTACPGNTELLTDGQTALLTPVGDVNAMAAALRDVLDDPRGRATLGARAAQAAARFSLGRMVEEYLALYGSALRYTGSAARSSYGHAMIREVPAPARPARRSA